MPPYGTSRRASYQKHVEPAFDTATVLQQVECRRNVCLQTVALGAGLDL